METSKHSGVENYANKSVKIPAFDQNEYNELDENRIGILKFLAKYLYFISVR